MRISDVINTDVCIEVQILALCTKHLSYSPSIFTILDNSANIAEPKVETEVKEADKMEENEEIDDSNSDKNVDGVIKVEILEGDKSKDEVDEVETATEQLYARDYPFTENENK